MAKDGIEQFLEGLESEPIVPMAPKEELEIFCGTTSARCPEVSSSDLMADSYYVVKIEWIDDESGEHRISRELAWFHEDQVIGQGMKKFKLFRFCKSNKTARFSQLPGAKFFGPVGIQ